MTPKDLRNRLHSGQTVIGTLIVSTSPRWPDAVRNCGLDFVFIDTEHIAMDRAQLSWMCQAYSAMGLPPLVRIPSPDPYAATMVLDGGAAGVIAPYVESADQVQALRGAVKSRPIKGIRLQEMLDGKPVEPELADYLQEAASHRLLIVNVESVPAIVALDKILAVPDLDSVLIGPHDLTCSLGIPEQYDHPDFLAACKTIFSKARAAGVGAGIHFWGDAMEQKRLLDLGANFLIHSGDIMLFQKHLKSDIVAIRQSLGLTMSESDQSKKEDAI